MTDTRSGDEGDRARGALLGTLVGDALGRPFEGSPRGDAERLRTAVQRRATAPRAWAHSDDGEMMLNLADALRERREVDERHILECLARGHDAARGYGKGTIAAFRAWRSGADPDAASRVLWAEGSRGNGAAVRVAPVAVWMAGAGEEVLAAAARRSAAATHAHEEARSGAAVVAVAVHRALHARDACDVVGPELRASVVGSFAELMRAVVGLRGVSLEHAVDALGNGVLAVESVPAAIWAFAGATSFDDAILRAVRLGGDTDSIGAMAGAVAGAFFGAVAIPSSWRSALEPDAVARVEQFVEWVS